MVLGDDLYCHQLFCQALLAQGLDFVLVCKPDSHPSTWDWLQMLDRDGQAHTLKLRRCNGHKVYLDCYRWAHALPLRDGEDALVVGWCELSTTDEADKMMYHNRFASSVPVRAENVVTSPPPGAHAGRSKTKTTPSRPRATASSTTSATASST